MKRVSQLLVLAGAVILLIIPSTPDVMGLEPRAKPGENDLPAGLIVKDGDWTVTGTETYSGSDILLNGNLTVRGKLVLDGSTLTINSTSGDIMTIWIRNGGIFEVKGGSTLKGGSSRRYAFQALNGSSVVLNGSSVYDCGLPSPRTEMKGVYSATSNFMVRDSTVMSGGSGLVADNGRFNVTGSTISMMDEDLVNLMNNSSLMMYDSDLTGPSFRGFSSLNSSSALHDVRISNSYRAMELEGSVMAMTNCSYSSQDSISVILTSSSLSALDCNMVFPGGNLIRVERPISRPSLVELVNTSVSDVIVLDPLAKATESYKFDIKVTTNSGLPAVMADVEVRGRTGALEFQELTDDNGWIWDVPVVAYLFNTTGRHRMDPHNLSVLYEGAQRQKDFDVLGSFWTSIRVLLNEPLVNIESPSDGSHLPTGEVTVRGAIEDVRPITSLSYILDQGQEVVLPEGDVFSIPLSLLDGKHKVVVLAMNDDGKLGMDTVTFFTDTLPPLLEVVTPSGNALTNKTTIMIAGTCEEGAKLLIDEDLVAHPGGFFRYYKQLSEGKNSVKVRSEDLAGNSVEVVLTVTSDTIPPFLMVLAPMNGSVTASESIVVEGTTSPDAVKVLVNGHPALLTGNSFKATVEDLTEGRNDLLVEAFDAVSWRTAKEVSVIVDTTAPMIVLSDIPEVVSTRDIQVSGFTEEGASLFINGFEIAVSFGRFSATVELYEGPNSILLRAVDQVGNMFDKRVQVVLDMQSPTIEMVDPPSGTTITKGLIEVKGRAFDEYGIDRVEARRMGGERYDVSGTEQWSFMATLLPGENLVLVEVWDIAGNLRTAQVRYIYESPAQEDTERPIIFILTPRVNSTLDEGPVEVSGTASDNVALEEVQVRVGEGEWKSATGLNSWNTTLDLKRGLYIIEARAVDTSGNIGTSSVRITIVVGTSQEDDDEGLPAIFYFSAIILVLMFAFALFFLLARRQALRSQMARMEEGIRSERGRKRPSAPSPRPPHAAPRETIAERPGRQGGTSRSQRRPSEKRDESRSGQTTRGHGREPRSRGQERSPPIQNK